MIKGHAGRNIPLGYDEAYSLGLYLIEASAGNEQARIQSFAVLSALHNMATYAWRINGRRTSHPLPQNAAEQIAGVCAAVFDRDIAVSEFGFLKPNVPFAMDNCGMGGDLILTANVSTIAAFIASAAGIPMCKHGSPGNATACGSSDFIDLCGINKFATREAVERCVETLAFGYTEALDVRYKHIHLQTHKIADLPHMNDIIGPITNPVLPEVLSRRVLGLNHMVPPAIAAEAYKTLNERGVTRLTHGLFLRGFAGSKEEGGMDELSICDPGTQVAELKDGVITEYWLRAEDFGIKPIPVEAVSPPSGMTKGRFSMSIMEGNAPVSVMQMVLANAALLFYLADRSQDLKQCYSMAEEFMMRGKAHQRMLQVREMLPAK
jgi:anthranilate phosphoribosyltransferase